MNGCFLAPENFYGLPSAQPPSILTVLTRAISPCQQNCQKYPLHPVPLEWPGSDAVDPVECLLGPGQHCIHVLTILPSRDLKYFVD